MGNAVGYSGGLTNPMTAVGDLIDGGTAGAAQRLAVGASGQVLTVSSGAPAWANSAAGFSNPMTAVGDLIDGGTAGAAQRLAIGTSGQVLTVSSGAPAWASAGGPAEWLNVIKQYGAKGDDSTDDWPAINNALTAAGNGQVVYLPYTAANSYRTSKPIVVPPGVKVIGPGAQVWGGQGGTGILGPTIKPLATWSQGTAAAAAVVLICDQTSGGFSVTSENQAFKGVGIDGSALPVTADGLQLLGLASSIQLEDLWIYHCTGRGYAEVINGSGGPGTIRANRVTTYTNGQSGYRSTASDSTYFDCLSLGDGTAGTYDAWDVLGTGGNNKWIGCRGEWSSGKGWNVTYSPSFDAALTMEFLGISTDRNAQDGFFLTGTGGAAVKVDGFFHRDGRNGGAGGGGYAMVKVSAFSGAVTLNVSTAPGTDDNGTGTNSAQYGLSVVSMGGVGEVKASGSVFHGASTSVNYDGSAAQFLVSPDCIYLTGDANAPTVGTAPALPILNGGTGQATQQTAIDALTGTQSSGKYLRSDGTHATLASIVAGDVPTLNQNTTGTAAGLSATLAVTSGGTGDTSLTSYALLTGGTTSTGAVQSLAGVGTSGQVLTSNGAAALPTFQAAAAASAIMVPWLPADNGYLAGVVDPALLGAGFTPTAGKVYLAAIPIRAAITVTKIYWQIQNAATGSSTGSFTGLYTSAGSIISAATSADIGANFTSGGGALSSTPVSCTLGASQSLSAGTVVIAALVLNMTGMPTMFRTSSGVRESCVFGQTNPAWRTASYATASQTSLPSSLGTVNSEGNVPACWLA